MSEQQPPWDPDGHQPRQPAFAAGLENELRYGRAPRRRRWLARFFWEPQACRGLGYSPRLPSNQRGKSTHVVRHLLASIEAGVVATAVLGPTVIGGGAAFFPHAEGSAAGDAIRSSPAAHAASSAHAAIGSNTPVPAAPSNLTAKAAGATSVQLTWTNNASNQSGVVISLNGEQSVDLQGATVSSYTWNGLSPNTKYWFYVASKIYGTPGDPTGYGNTQSAWVGPAYATTAGTQPSTSPAPQPSTSPAQQPSTSPAQQPSTSPGPQPSPTGSGVPTTLPTRPSPTFVCVTGPGGSCLKPGAGVPVPQIWAPTVPGWLTSGVTGGCVAEVITLPEFELWTLFEKMGDAIQFDESNGNFFVLLSAATGLGDYCSQLGYDLLTGKPVPQNIDFTRGAASPRHGTVLDSVIRPASPAAAPSLFKPVPKSQLASIEKLPFLRQRFGYVVAQVGAAAALSQKYPAGWGAATHKNVVCRLQQGGYRCAWNYQLNRAHHSGYVLVAVTANNYRLGKVAEATQAAPASPAFSLSPLWYISIAAAAVIIAIVVAVLRRRRRATVTVQ